jgi:hypothetical protein
MIVDGTRVRCAIALGSRSFTDEGDTLYDVFVTSEFRNFLPSGCVIQQNDGIVSGRREDGSIVLPNCQASDPIEMIRERLIAKSSGDLPHLDSFVA